MNMMKRKTTCCLNEFVGQGRRWLRGDVTASMNRIGEKTKQKEQNMKGYWGGYACSHTQGNEQKWREQGFEIFTTTCRFGTELGNELSIGNLIHSSDGSVAFHWVKNVLHFSMLHIENLLSCDTFSHQYNLHEVDEIQNWRKHDTYTKLLYVVYKNTVWRKLMHDTTVTNLTTV